MSLRVSALSFSYGDRRVLSSVNFEISTGEVWALIGRSGCGKTTLLHIIAGLYRPDAGEVHFSGRNWGPGCVRGVVFQEDGLLGWLNVKNNVLFPHNASPDDARLTRAQHLLGAVGLGDRLESFPYELSVGMRKRLEVARAFMADDGYVLADEPFGTVDAVTRLDLWALWQELRRNETRTGILCTHDTDEAIRLCDAVMVLRTEPIPSKLTLIRVPASVRTLPSEESSEELAAMRRQIIGLLHEE